jgi:hypothetical protein
MFDQDTLATLESNYRTTKKQQQAAQPKKKNPRLSWLSAIPSVAAAGASLIPGVGTAGAAALGGLGELGKQAIEGNGFDVKKIGTEAALSAIPGGLGKLGKLSFKGAKAGKAIAEGSKAVKEGTKAAEGATTLIKAPGGAKGIPVKYTASGAEGTGVSQTAKSTLTDPSIQQIEDTSSNLLKKGYATTTKVGKTTGRTQISGRGIPVKYVDSTATGSAVPSAVSKTITGKSPDEVVQLTEGLIKRGYKVDVKNGAIQGRKSFNGGGASVFERADKTPVTQVTAKKQSIPLSVGDETTSVLPAKAPKFGKLPAKSVVGIEGKRTAVPFKTIQGSEEVLPAKAQSVLNTTDGVRTEAPAATSMLSKVKSRLQAPGSQETGIIAGAGQKLRASNRGIQAGDKIGKEVVDETRAKELNDAISGANKGMLGKTVRGQVKGVQQARDAAAKELDTAAANSKAVIDAKTKESVAKSIGKERANILHFDPANKAHIDLNNRYAARLDAASTPKEILEARRVFGQAAKKVYTNPDATQTLDKELADVYYKHANTMLDKIAPEVRAADKKVSTYIDAEKALTSSKSKVDASGVKPFGTSINGKGIGGGTLQAALDTAGKTLEAVGGNSKAATFGRGLTGQVATRLAAAPVTASAAQPSDALEGEIVDPASEDTNLDTAAAGGDQTGTGTPDPATVNKALQVALLQALGKGDYQGISAIKTAMDVFATTADKPLTASQATRAAAAKNALNDVPLIEEAISSGKLGGAKALPGSGTQLGRRALGTENLDAALFNIADNILRARSGAAAPDSEIKRFVETFLPSPTDSKKAKNQKLARAVRELNGYVNPTAATEDTLDGLTASQ